MSRMLYFGCWNQAGHYLHHPNGSTRFPYDPTPEYPIVRCLDGCFAPRVAGGKQPEEATTLSHLHGWTVLAMWDRSVDSRPGSNAAFLMPGTHNAAAMWSEARRVYPQIVSRLKAAASISRDAAPAQEEP